MENLTQRWIQSGPFLQNEGVFFRFSKKGRIGTFKSQIEIATGTLNSP